MNAEQIIAAAQNRARFVFETTDRDSGRRARQYFNKACAALDFESRAIANIENPRGHVSDVRRVKWGGK